MPSWLICSWCGGMCKQHLLAAAELQSSKDFSVRGLWGSSRPTSFSKQGFMGSSYLLFWKIYCVSGNALSVASELAGMCLVSPWITTRQVYFCPSHALIGIRHATYGSIFHDMYQLRWGNTAVLSIIQRGFVQVLMGHRCHETCQPLLQGGRSKEQMSAFDGLLTVQRKLRGLSNNGGAIPVTS